MIFMGYWIIYFKEFLSFTQISALLTIMLISPLFFEVPTGIIADLFGRKFSSILSFLIDGLVFIGIYFTHNFTSLLLLFIAFGLGQSLYSGAQNAWTVDCLINNDRKSLQKVFFQRSSFIRNLGTLLASIIGMILVKNYSMSIIWFISGFGSFIGGITLFLKKEHFDNKKRSVIETYKEFISITKKGFVYTFNHKDLLHFIGFISVLFLVGDLAWVSWEPELKNIGLPVFLFGMIIFLKSIFGLLISSSYHKLIEKIGYKKSLFSGILILSILYFLAFFTYKPYIFLIIIAAQYAFWESFFYPVMEDYLHNFYISKIRATLESITNLILMISASIGTLLGGIFTDIFGPRKMILTSGILILLSLINLKIMMIKKKKLKTQNELIKI
jgi:MFS family permease